MAKCETISLIAEILHFAMRGTELPQEKQANIMAATALAQCVDRVPFTDMDLLKFQYV